MPIGDIRFRGRKEVRNWEGRGRALEKRWPRLTSDLAEGDLTARIGRAF